MSLLYGNGTNGREENFGHLYKRGTALYATGKAKKRFLVVFYFRILKQLMKNIIIFLNIN